MQLEVTLHYSYASSIVYTGYNKWSTRHAELICIIQDQQYLHLIIIDNNDYDHVNTVKFENFWRIKHRIVHRRLMYTSMQLR